MQVLRRSRGVTGISSSQLQLALLCNVRCAERIGGRANVARHRRGSSTFTQRHTYSRWLGLGYGVRSILGRFHERVSGTRPRPASITAYHDPSRRHGADTRSIVVLQVSQIGIVANRLHRNRLRSIPQPEFETCEHRLRVQPRPTCDIASRR